MRLVGWMLRRSVSPSDSFGDCFHLAFTKTVLFPHSLHNFDSRTPQRVRLSLVSFWTLEASEWSFALIALA